MKYYAGFSGEILGPETRNFQDPYILYMYCSTILLYDT